MLLEDRELDRVGVQSLGESLEAVVDFFSFNGPLDLTLFEDDCETVIDFNSEGLDDELEIIQSALSPGTYMLRVSGPSEETQNAYSITASSF